MAMTALGFSEIRIVGNAIHVGSLGPKRITFGRAALSSGSVELDTGLNSVDGFFALGVYSTGTEALVLSCQEELPLAGSGTVTVDGTLVDEGGTTKDGASETFNWIAIGE